MESSGIGNWSFMGTPPPGVPASQSPAKEPSLTPGQGQGQEQSLGLEQGRREEQVPAQGPGQGQGVREGARQSVDHLSVEEEEEDEVTPSEMEEGSARDEGPLGSWDDPEAFSLTSSWASASHPPQASGVPVAHPEALSLTSSWASASHPPQASPQASGVPALPLAPVSAPQALQGMQTSLDQREVNTQGTVQAAAVEGGQLSGPVPESGSGPESGLGIGSGSGSGSGMQMQHDEWELVEAEAVASLSSYAALWDARLRRDLNTLHPSARYSSQGHTHNHREHFGQSLMSTGERMFASDPARVYSLSSLELLSQSQPGLLMPDTDLHPFPRHFDNLRTVSAPPSLVGTWGNRSYQSPFAPCSKAGSTAGSTAGSHSGYSHGPESSQSTPEKRGRTSSRALLADRKGAPSLWTLWGLTAGENRSNSSSSRSLVFGRGQSGIRVPLVPAAAVVAVMGVILVVVASWGWKEHSRGTRLSASLAASQSVSAASCLPLVQDSFRPDAPT